MTIPNLVEKYQKAQTVNRLKLVYSQLNEAIKLSEVENDDISGWDSTLTGSQLFEKYILPYMKGVSKVSLKNAPTFGKYKRRSGTIENALAMLRDAGLADIYTTINGTQIFVSSTTFSDSFRDVVVDLNGFTPPNQFGKDLFYFTLSPSKKLYPFGMYNTSEFTFETEPNMDRDILRGAKNPKTGGLNYQCNKYKRGTWCAALIMVDGWQIKDDYPW